MFTNSRPWVFSRSLVRCFAASVATLCAIPIAQAGILSFSAVSGNTSAGFSFENGGYQGVELYASCGGCVNVTFPASLGGPTGLGGYGFDAYPVATLPYPPVPATFYTQSFGGGSLGISIGSGPTNVIAAHCAPFTIFAQLGSSNAVFQCELDPLIRSSSIIALPAGNLYLILTGATSQPVSTETQCLPAGIGSLSPPCTAPATPQTSFGQTTIDWFGTVSTTPYTPQNLISVHSFVGESQQNVTTFSVNFGSPLEGVTTAPSTSVAAGIVISQNPPAGAMVPSGWPLDIVVSSGPVQITVPNVTGLTQIAAIAVLKTAGLTVTTVTSIPNTSAAGTVTAQLPSAGAMASTGSAVALTVSSGGATTTPDIHYAGDGTSSFNYTLYDIDGPPFEAFIMPAENNPASPYAVFGDTGAAGALGGGGSPFLFEMNYVDGTSPLVCGMGPLCYQPLKGSGTLTIIDVNSCQNHLISGGHCNSTTGNLGAGTIYAGDTLANLSNNSVTQGKFQLTYTPTSSFDGPSGITTLTPQASLAYLIISGSSAQTTGFGAGSVIAPAPVTVCYAGSFGCSAQVSAGGIYFNPFDLDWGATLSATPFASPPAQVTVPNVVNATQAAAVSSIVAVAGLSVGTVVTQSSSAVATGRVISESPAAGSSVPSGTAINLVVSSGPALITVPNEVGFTQGAASVALTAAGLKLGSVASQSSSTVAIGLVISETPTAGSSVQSGSAVNLILSAGPLVGDVNGDGVVNCADLMIVKAAFGSRVGAANYDPRADVNKDGVVNIVDLSTVARALPSGTICP